MTHALVVFESMFGNTKKIAEAIADGLRTEMAVELTEVGTAPALRWSCSSSAARPTRSA